MHHKPMVYLGDWPSQRIQRVLDEHGWGTVVIDDICSSAKKRPFILDNGAFGAWQSNTPWDEARYRKTLERVVSSGLVPDFAVLPDIVAGGIRSLEMSLSWIDRLPRCWRKALVTQDGIPPYEIFMAMCDPGIDVMFLGGSDAHKLHANDLCKMAHKLGKKFHYGRCGTLEKLSYASLIQADSLDSTLPMRKKKYLAPFLDVWLHGHPQKELFKRKPLSNGEYQHLDCEVKPCPKCGLLDIYCRCGVED